MILRNPSAWRDFLFIICSFTAWLSPNLSFSQGISGLVQEESTSRPVVDAYVQIIRMDSVVASLRTDANGRYTYTSTIADRIKIVVTALGYYQYHHEAILLDGYSTYSIETPLRINPFKLPDIIITSPRIPDPHVQTITAEDLAITAGNFDDPVRVAHSRPGIIQLNDQANHLSSRGQQPALNSWYLEGLEIVNPNHTNNAGMFSDLPTQSGGGVNMFSAQTLGSTDIYTGLNPLSIGRSAGAVIDMHLHESPKQELRAKASLLGFEFGSGWPFGPKAVLDLNLRYSFTGLLANLGVDFGGEKILFLDGVMSFRHQGTKHKLKIYSWAGESFNEFRRQEQIEDRERYKDFFNINFKTYLTGIGTKFDYVFNSKLSLRSGLSHSSSTTNYSREGQFGLAPVNLLLHDDFDIISSMAELIFAHSRKVHFTAGLNYTYHSINSFGPLRDESFIRPYVSTELLLSPRLKLDLGGEVNHSLITNNTIPGYRAVIEIGTEANIIYGGLRHGAGQSLVDFESSSLSQPVIVDKYEVGWKRGLKEQFFSLALYYQKLNNLAYYLKDNSIVSIADYADLIYGTVINNNGVGRYGGIEADWNYKGLSGWNLSANQTFYKSEKGIDGKPISRSRYDGRWATHFSASKEIIRERKGKNRIWEFSIRGLFNGGFLEPTIDESSSALQEGTVFINPSVFDQQLPAYKRIDAGISRIIANTKVRWRYSLDIQNLLGFENIAYHYYDPFLERVESQKQLGIIPVLAIQASW